MHICALHSRKCQKHSLRLKKKGLIYRRTRSSSRETKVNKLQPTHQLTRLQSRDWAQAVIMGARERAQEICISSCIGSQDEYEKGCCVSQFFCAFFGLCLSREGAVTHRRRIYVQRTDICGGFRPTLTLVRFRRFMVQPTMQRSNAQWNVRCPRNSKCRPMRLAIFNIVPSSLPC